MSEQELKTDPEKAGSREAVQYDFLPGQHFVVYEAK
jgi:hypothetical protein